MTHAYLSYFSTESLTSHQTPKSVPSKPELSTLGYTDVTLNTISKPGRKTINSLEFYTHYPFTTQFGIILL